MVLIMGIMRLKLHYSTYGGCCQVGVSDEVGLRVLGVLEGRVNVLEGREKTGTQVRNEYAGLRRFWG
jgi:hypothetical protein